MQATVQTTTLRKEFILTGSVLAIWFLLVAISTSTGVWGAFPFWAFPLFIAAGIIIPFSMYLTIPGLRDVLDSFSIQNLTRFHIWRIIAGAYFIKLGVDGVLPVTFAHNAGYGDLAVGFLAPLFIAGRRSRFQYLVFHILSMIDFVVAVGTGLNFTLLQVPLMQNIQTFPVALIPGFGVGFTGTLSLVTLYRLIKNNEGGRYENTIRI